MQRGDVALGYEGSKCQGEFRLVVMHREEPMQVPQQRTEGKKDLC